ncbi:MAG TPA: hypothetical protein VFD39_11960 [Trueperaceae bacterium]|nr:hypothetical protein [Trueperaceae bacterium]
MKRFILVVAAAAAVLVLAACSVTVEPPGPPADAIAVTANSNPATPLDPGRTYAPNEQKVFRVTVPSGVASDDLLYIELSRNLRLEVRPAGNNYSTVSYSATSYEYFGSGLTGIASTGVDSGLSGQAVDTPVTCRGSCVILESAPSEFYVRVKNTGATPVNDVDLYVYGDIYADALEPENNTIATAPTLPSFDGGAIETVGDVDFWEVLSDGDVAFDVVANGIALEAHIVDSNGTPIAGGVGGPYFDGASLPVIVGDFIRVWTVDQNKAASSSYSGYYLDYGGPLSQAQRR